MRWFFTAAMLLCLLVAEPAAADDLKVDCMQAQTRAMPATCPPNRQDDLTDGAELRMTQLQNLISRRETANQIAAHLLEEQQETTDDILDHLGN